MRTLFPRLRRPLMSLIFASLIFASEAVTG